MGAAPPCHRAGWLRSEALRIATRGVDAASETARAIAAGAVGSGALWRLRLVRGSGAGAEGGAAQHAGGRG
eukprot:874350-Prymnesium_polylepis.2